MLLYRGNRFFYWNRGCLVVDVMADAVNFEDFQEGLKIMRGGIWGYLEI